MLSSWLMDLHTVGYSAGFWATVSSLSVCLSVMLVVGVLLPNSWMDQDETLHGGRPRPRPHCVRWGPSSPKRGTSPNFWPMSVVAKQLGGSRYQLVQR